MTTFAQMSNLYNKRMMSIHCQFEKNKIMKPVYISKKKISLFTIKKKNEI